MNMSALGQKRTCAAQKACVRFAESGHFRTRSKAAAQSFKRWQEWRSGRPPKVLIVVCRSMDCQSARRPTRKVPTKQMGEEEDSSSDKCRSRMDAHHRWGGGATSDN